MLFEFGLDGAFSSLDCQGKRVKAKNDTLSGMPLKNG